jgi:DNA-binding IclR family transcriptional regulator
MAEPDTDYVPMLLHLLAGNDDVSLPRAAKRLGLQASELQRLLTALGADPRYDGLGLIEQRSEGGRTLLRLTARGRALCATS